MTVAVLVPASALADHSVTELVSVPTTGANPSGAVATPAVSPNGAHIALHTSERWHPADTDTQSDVYIRSYLTDTTTLASVGPNGGNGAILAFAHKLADSGRVIFSTTESLVASDTDSSRDLYEHMAGTTTLLSTGPGSSGSVDATFVDASPDATHVLFETAEPLTGVPTGPDPDLYVRSGGTTSFVGRGPLGVARISEAGDRVVFATTAALTSDDTDIRSDIYAREGNTTTLLTIGSSGGNGDFHIGTLTGATPDLESVQFEASESLVPEDTDGTTDAYLNEGGVTTLVSPGGGSQDQGLGVAEDGSRSWFKTAMALTADDTDSWPDIYERRGAAVKLISRNTPIHRDFDLFIFGGDPGFVGASYDGTRVFFKTENEATPDDVDPNRCLIEEDDEYYRKRCDDIFMYDQSTDTITHVTTGPGVGGAYDVEWLAQVSDDGTRLIFETMEPLLGQEPSLGTGCHGDIDFAGGAWEDSGCPDVYERTLDGAPQTYLLSRGITGGFGPHPARRVPIGGVGVMSDDGRRVYFNTAEQLTPDDTDTTHDIYVSATAEHGGYPRPKAASSIQVSLVPAAAACTAPNRTHGPPLAFPSCSPPAPASEAVTVGGSGSFPANSTGLVRLDMVPGVPGGEDDTDVAVRVNVTSVWQQTGTRVDYDGALQARIGLRTTDKDGAVPSTIGDRTLAVDVPCTTTVDDATGSTCSVITTADAVQPGVAGERTRAVWELGQVRVFDGGPDGDPGTQGDNTLFMTQGVFVP
jgi:hypothetical protein